MIDNNDVSDIDISHFLDADGRLSKGAEFDIAKSIHWVEPYDSSDSGFYLVFSNTRRGENIEIPGQAWDSICLDDRGPAFIRDILETWELNQRSIDIVSVSLGNLEVADYVIDHRLMPIMEINCAKAQKGARLALYRDDAIGLGKSALLALYYTGNKRRHYIFDSMHLIDAECMTEEVIQAQVAQLLSGIAKQSPSETNAKKFLSGLSREHQEVILKNKAEPDDWVCAILETERLRAATTPSKRASSGLSL